MNIFVLFFAAFAINYAASFPTHSSDTTKKSSRSKTPEVSTSSASQSSKRIPTTSSTKESNKKNTEKGKKKAEQEITSTSNRPQKTKKQKFEESLELIFRLMDRNKNNKISVEDLKKYMLLQNQDLNYTENEISKMDKNKDGVITHQEFKDYLGKKEESSTNEEQLKLLFKMLDKDEDGFLSKKEIKDLFLNVDKDHDDATAKMIANTVMAGTKKKGFMSSEEFKTIFGQIHSEMMKKERKEPSSSTSSRQKGKEIDSLTELLSKSLGPKKGAEEGYKLSFKKLDKDKDGFLGENDIKEYLKSIGRDSSKEGVKKHMAKIGTNKDGKIGTKEYMAYLKSSDRFSETEMKESFEDIDTDKDGIITAKDFCKYIEKIYGESIPPEKLESSILSEMFVKKKGQMNFEEYKRLQKTFSFAALNKM